MKIAKDVWSIDEGDLSYEDEAMRAHAKKMIFPIGEPNDKFAQSTDVYAVKASNYKGLRIGSPV